MTVRLFLGEIHFSGMKTLQKKLIQPSNIRILNVVTIPSDQSRRTSCYDLNPKHSGTNQFSAPSSLIRVDVPS